jgi:hypothetical protein
VLRMDVLVHDADGQTSSFAWQDDCEMSFDNTAAPVVNWTCPEVSRGGEGKVCNIYVIALDPDGNQAWAFEPIEVRPEGFGLYDPFIEVVPATGACATAPTGVAAWTTILGAAALLRRRRRA